jgi:uncharacterized protein YutE (UPF0331/DUF86 family)
MSSTNVVGDEARLFDVAEKYRQRGYRVTVSPHAKELPRFLSKFKPDIVAEGPDESVVIEVKSSGKKRNTDYWRELSRVVQSHPRWRLEFVVDASKRAVRETIHEEQIRERLEEGRRLAERRMFAAALLISWSAAEAAMRLASEAHEIELPDLRPAAVISRLYTDGVLERDEYDFLLELMAVRNAVAHGFYQGKIRTIVLKKLQQIALRLLQQSALESKAE